MNEDSYPAFGVLVVDDEPAWLRSMRISLARLAGITNVLTCQDSREVMNLLSLHECGIVLLDLTMPHLSGEELLTMIGEQYPEAIVIIVSGMNQIETAVRCMKQGAFDYVVKTAEEDRIITVIQHAIRLIEMQRENSEMSRRFLSDTIQNPEAFSGIITINKTMRSIFQYVEAVAKSNQPLLITGESGVGKGLIAKVVHELSGCKGELISVNVGGLDDTMFTDTLFGHVKGAFTGADQARSGMIEKAANGTLFLDEIGDLSNASQVKLLRLLQEGDYFPLGSDQPKRLKARVIASTHQNLSEKQAQGAVRKDLYYRLKTHHIHLPPLRERKEDIPALLDYFLEEASRELGKRKPDPTFELRRLLERYDYPGNVRELRSMVYDAVARNAASVISTEPFQHALAHSLLMPKGHTGNVFDAVESLPTIHQAVSLLINSAMQRANGNQSVACRLLGISQPALSRRIKNMQSGVREED
ncbi:MAG TPA: sigma-54 dependent transcriptional regulator [Dissulfurispiraceae bacterium]|nr:sigma-54 dependent transcriptional regulator [Dissulfurispiraceae bacterium]